MQTVQSSLNFFLSGVLFVKTDNRQNSRRKERTIFVTFTNIHIFIYSFAFVMTTFYFLFAVYIITTPLLNSIITPLETRIWLNTNFTIRVYLSQILLQQFPTDKRCIWNHVIYHPITANETITKWASHPRAIHIRD